MRFASRLIALLLASSVALGSASSRAGEDESVTHFRVGVRLFQDRNYVGALAEFEESFRLKPTASALQNVALCQKALFRYAEAIATLEQMLSQYGPQLAAEDAKAARSAIDEMRPLVAQVTIAVTPAEAEVTIDGRKIAGSAERTINLNVGEHRIVAEAPRYRRYEQMVALAGGARRIDIVLDSDVGELALSTGDAEASITIDGQPRGFGAFRGELSAGAPHVVQIHKKGHATVERTLTLDKGEHRELSIEVGPPEKSEPPPPLPPPLAPMKRGWYGYLSATTYAIGTDPDGFKTPKGSSGGRDAAFFGLRLGHRFTNTFGLEGVFEFGKHSVGAGCYTPSNTDADCTEPIPGGGVFYDRSAQRFGVGGRFYTAGDRFRFLAAAAVGGVHYQVTIFDDATQPKEGSGVNAFALLEGGVELSFGKVLVEGVLVVTVDGASNLSTLKKGERFYTDNRNVAMAGLGLRVGWGQW